MIRILAIAMVAIIASSRLLVAAEADYFEIQVIDAATQRGVPLVELTTTHHLRFVTDSAGRVAFREPELMGQEVFFAVRSHGYEFAADGFGMRGLRLKPVAGEKAVVQIKRLNIAERVYRVTGEGIYGDSLLLGHQPPIGDRLLNAGVVGQDSVQVAQYQDKLYWFWGDTTLAYYPLGNFRTSGATSPLPGKELNPNRGIPLTYFTNERGHSRPMVTLANEEGVVWIDALATVPDKDGNERMVCHYERRQGLEKQLEHGIAVWDDKLQVFQSAKVLAASETSYLRGHTLRHQDGDSEYLYSGATYPTLRVPARLEDVVRPDKYEAWTCLDDDGKVVRDAEGMPQFAWKAGAIAWTPASDKKLAAEHQQLSPRDLKSDQPIRLHGGTVRWNKHRKKWIAVGVQDGGDASYLGEVWYSEADAPTGPFRRAAKIVTHDKFSFYNPVHHDYFDADGGRTIYFEGTYTFTFSRDDNPTPRYDYNQVMYRLDLDDKRLMKVRE